MDATISGRRSPRRLTIVGAGMPLGGYQSPSGRTAGLLVSGSRRKPLCRRADRDPEPYAPSSTMNAYACVSYGSLRSTFGSPMTSLRPSRSRSAIDGGEAVHWSQAVLRTSGHSPTCRW